MEWREVLTGTICSLVVLAAGGLGADDGRIEIGPTDVFPIVIRAPGSYILTTDLEVVDENVDAIKIQPARDVTLDLGGHVIRGPCPATGTGTGHGVDASGTSSGLRIRNGIVTCLSYGISTLGVTNYGGIIIENITATDNSIFGIDSKNAVITNCSAYGNGLAGIRAQGSVISDCVSSGNGETGIDLYGGGGLVTGSVARFNNEHGIKLLGRGNQVAFCSVTNNAEYGIYMLADGNNNISHSAGSQNGSGNVINCGVGNGCHHNMLP